MQSQVRGRRYQSHRYIRKSGGGGRNRCTIIGEDWLLRLGANRRLQGRRTSVTEKYKKWEINSRLGYSEGYSYFNSPQAPKSIRLYWGIVITKRRHTRGGFPYSSGPVIFEKKESYGGEGGGEGDFKDDY